METCSPAGAAKSATAVGKSFPAFNFLRDAPSPIWGIILAVIYTFRANGMSIWRSESAFDAATEKQRKRNIQSGRQAPAASNAMNILAWNEAVDAVYRAAAEPLRWPEALHQVAILFDAMGATLLHRHDDGRIGVIVSPTLSALNEEYGRRWQHLDVRAERVLSAIASGRRDVQADHTVCTATEVATLPIYQDFLIPNGIGWSVGVSVSPTPEIAVALSLLRSLGKPTFSDAEQEHVLAFSRHIERALSLSIRLMDAEAENLSLAGALDRLDCGVFILDADQRILTSNARAGALLGRGLMALDGRLTARSAQTRRALQDRLVARFTGQEQGRALPGTLVLENGEHSLLLQIMPLPVVPGPSSLQTASTIVLVVETGHGRPFDPAVVRDVFQLTLGEARLAALIGAGVSPGKAAETLGISENTVRTVLKRVFEKMGVSRQNELAALLGKLFMLRQG
ncbi:helix-turn-helix transcriptional regulator [Methylobacterium longum]|uniref:helix-turn-helix transcriptional regulator n=1 Tax=Methylobacterium longum TaxID=767694 RepID=UPI001EE3099D|nr:helix-turn-helix transcriptional regulator [Methylobacterium longum]